MKKDEKREKEVIEINDNKKLKQYREFLEKDHSTDCLFLLYMNRGKWQDAKEFRDMHDWTLPDGTFRDRMIEAEKLGLAKSELIDPKKHYWEVTPLGYEVIVSLMTHFNYVIRVFKQYEK